MLLEEQLPGTQEEEQEQSPRALFQSIRSLIAEASDIQDRYHAASLPRLQALFLQQTDFALYCREAELSQAALAARLQAADEALGERLDRMADFVIEMGEGQLFRFRLWQSGKAELWGSFSVQAEEDTPLTIPLPFALKNALAFVQGMEYEALSAGKSLSLTPREAGEKRISVLLLGEKEEEA